MFQRIAILIPALTFVLSGCATSSVPYLWVDDYIGPRMDAGV